MWGNHEIVVNLFVCDNRILYFCKNFVNIGQNKA